MRLDTITHLVCKLIGKQYTPIIDVAIYSFEADMAVKFTERQIGHLACKSRSLYDQYRKEVFEGDDNPYTFMERQELIKYHLHGKDLSLYVSTLDLG